MGIGYYRPSLVPGVPGEFDLVISFRFDATAVIDEWKNALFWASNSLFQATRGQMRLGRLVFVNNSGAPDEADVYILDEEFGIATYVGDYGELGTTGFHIDLKGLTLQLIGQFTHELGHYALGLGEEYQGPPPGTLPANCRDTNLPALVAECTDANNACIMQRASSGLELTAGGVDFSSWGDTTEFCVDANHDLDGDTEQACLTRDVGDPDGDPGKSCWQAINANPKYPDVGIPAPVSTGDVPADPMQHTDILWEERTAEPRIALALDESGSMQAEAAIDGVKFGAHAWVDLERLIGGRLAIVSYDDGAAPIVPLDLVGDDAAADFAHDQITDELDAFGSTNITEALCLAGQQVQSLESVKKRVILFSDGIHNVGPPPGAAVCDPGTGPLPLYDFLTTEGIKVHTISFGDNAGRPLLEEIANQTTGEYRHIDPPGDQDDAHHDINTAITELAGESHSGLLASERPVLASFEDDPAGLGEFEHEPHSREDLDGIRKLSTDEARRRNMHDLEVFVEEGCDRATFVMTSRFEHPVALYLFRPGEVGSSAPVIEPTPDVFIQRGTHAIYSIEGPEPGYWTMRARKEVMADLETMPLGMFAFSENRQVSIGLAGTSKLYDRRETVQLQAQVSYKESLEGVKATFWPADAVTPEQRSELSRYLADTSRPGRYRNTELAFDEPGSYEFVAEFVNDGGAIAVQDPHLAELAEARGFEPPEPFVPPPFRRVKRFQIHVGPLPPGRDLDAVSDKEEEAS